jgi:hypothetical protein
VSRTRKRGSLHPLLIRLHSVVFNLLGTGTTLHFVFQKIQDNVSKSSVRELQIRLYKPELYRWLGVGPVAGVNNTERRKISLLPELECDPSAALRLPSHYTDNRLDLHYRAHAMLARLVRQSSKMRRGSANRSNSANSRRSAKIICLTQQPGGLRHEAKLPEVPGTQGQGQSS